MTSSPTARLAHDDWGDVETPVFMPVGTAATVKGMMPDSVRETGASIILANTYHLMLRPGAERVGRLGGVRRMMGWDGPLLTDSGGFQVMSLGPLRSLDEDGVTFKSHLDGTRYRLTPERSTEIQHLLDATITMAFDECTPFTEEVAAPFMRWACCLSIVRVTASSALSRDGLYLRADIVAALEESRSTRSPVGEDVRDKEFSTPMMRADKPRYLMGVGKPDLVGGVARGVDMFDCVMPTRSGRTGQCRGPVIKTRHAEMRRWTRSRPARSRAYLHHLFKADEVLSLMLLSWHNIQYYQDLMAGMRAAIEAGTFAEFEADFHAKQALGDIEPAG